MLLAAPALVTGRDYVRDVSMIPHHDTSTDSAPSRGIPKADGMFESGHADGSEAAGKS